MNEQLRFLQMVEELAQIGKEKNGQLKRAEVEDYLKEHNSSVQYLEAICEFLFAKQVLVEGYAPKKDLSATKKRRLTEEEASFKADYEEELKKLGKPAEPQDLIFICDRLGKDEDAVVELSTAILPYVYKITSEYAGSKVQFGDLVQEGNLAAMMEIAEIAEGTNDDRTGEKILHQIEQKVTLSIEALIAEEQDSNLEAKKVVNKLNQLVEAVEALKEQQAEYTLEDLAEFLAMEIEEIENLLRIAGELEEEES